MPEGRSARVTIWSGLELAAIAAASVGTVAALCAGLLGLHLEAPVTFALAAVLLWALVRLALAATAHVRLSRALHRNSDAGELGGVPVRYAAGALPFVVGLLRPVIYCDRGIAARLTPRQQRAVALHELHHRRHRDPLRLQVLLAVAPVARLAPQLTAGLERNQARLEIAADRFALRHGASRADIAGALLALLGSPLAARAPGFTSAAELRLRALGGEAPAAGPARRRLLVGAIAALLSAAVVCLPLARNIPHDELAALRRAPTPAADVTSGGQL